MSRDILHAIPNLRRFAFSLLRRAAVAIPIKPGRLICYLIGTGSWLCDARGRKAVRRNLAHFIPADCPDALARCVRRNYINFAQYLFESFRMDRLPPTYFQPPNFRLSDPFGVFAQRPLKGPAILVTVHCNWEILLSVFNRCGLTDHIKIVVLSSGDAAIDQIFNAMRQSVNAESLNLKQAPLGSLRALRAGKIVGIAGDRDYTGNGMQIPFAGSNISLPLGPAALAVQTGALIVPLYLGRHGMRGLQLIVDKPLRADPTKSKETEVRRLLEELSFSMARFLGCAPSQWVAFHDAWDSRADSSRTMAPPA